MSIHEQLQRMYTVFVLRNVSTIHMNNLYGSLHTAVESTINFGGVLNSFCLDWRASNLHTRPSTAGTQGVYNVFQIYRRP